MSEGQSKKKRGGFGILGSLIMTMVLMVVGAALIAPMQESVKNISTTTTVEQVQQEDGTTTEVEKPTYSSAVKTLSSIIPLLMVIVIILAVFKGMEDIGDDNPKSAKSRIRKFVKNSKEFVLKIETSSRKYAKFVQNLDKLLGVKSMQTSNADRPLELFEDTLKISDEYDWFITDKLDGKYIFKVIGLHKKDTSENVACLLGIDEENNKPKLVQINFNDDRPIDKIVAGKW